MLGCICTVTIIIVIVQSRSSLHFYDIQLCHYGCVHVHGQGTGSLPVTTSVLGVVLCGTAYFRLQWRGLGLGVLGFSVYGFEFCGLARGLELRAVGAGGVRFWGEASPEVVLAGKGA